MQLTAWLKKEGIRQTELADRLEVARSTVSRLIRKQRAPSVHMALRIGELTKGKVGLKDLIK